MKFKAICPVCGDSEVIEEDIAKLFDIKEDVGCLCDNCYAKANPGYMGQPKPYILP